MEPYGFYFAYTNTVDHLDEVNPDALFAHALESACIGHTEIWTSEGTRLSLAVYSKQKIVKHLVADENMLFSEAEKYAEDSIYSVYMGPNTPIYVDETYAPHPTMQPTPEDMYEL